MKFTAERDLADPLTPTHYYYLDLIKPYLKSDKTSVLDIGCWTGAMEMLLEKEKCTVTAIDIEKEPLQVAKKRFPKYRFVQASITEPLPFKKNEFDIVLYFMVIEHIQKGLEHQSLENLNMIMKKGGHIFLTTMHSNPLSNLLDPAYWLVGHRHYSKDHLESVLEHAGFEIKEVYYNGGFFTTLHIWLLYFFKHVLRMREPRGKLMDSLIRYDYRNKGFAEIDIHAVKVKEI